MAEGGGSGGRPGDVLLGNALSLARELAQSLRDMRGIDYRLDPASQGVRPFRGGFSMQVSIRFMGGVEGEYILGLRPETAAQLGGTWRPDQGEAAMGRQREDWENFLKEALNTAVGNAMPTLDRIARGGRFQPAVVAYEPPGQSGPACGQVNLYGSAGPIACCFLLYPSTREAAG